MAARRSAACRSGLQQVLTATSGVMDVYPGPPDSDGRGRDEHRRHGFLGEGRGPACNPGYGDCARVRF
eukprot:8870425-Prorocentrum_lima.AAC.1